MYTPKPSSFWWTQNPRYLLYFLRELTGVVIAFSTLAYLTAFLFEGPVSAQALRLFETTLPIALGAAIFHALTWFWVAIKILPLPPLRWLRLLAFGILCSLWIGASYLILNYFYAPIF